MIGAYIKGSDQELDEAINKKEVMEQFMSQGATFSTTFDEARNVLITMMAASKP